MKLMRLGPGFLPPDSRLFSSTVLAIQFWDCGAPDFQGPNATSLVAVAWQQGTTARTDQIEVHCCHALACISQGERVLCGAWPAQHFCGSAQSHGWSVRLEKPGRNLGGAILAFLLYYGRVSPDLFGQSGAVE